MFGWARLALVLILLSVGLTAAAAQAPSKRVALVIGNSAYAHATTLANPGPDAQIVRASLERAGFSVVMRSNASKQEMELALRDFSNTADGAEVALIYFAGHGMEAGGTNWLVPVDARLTEERSLRFEAIGLELALAAVEGASGLRIVVLDACRNNPFEATMRRPPGATRAVTRGLADIEVTGTLVLYAARAGSVAVDGPPGRNSPFAEALAKRIVEPGIDIRVLVGKIRDDVLSATDGRQEPFSYGSLPGIELILVPAGQDAADAVTQSEMCSFMGVIERATDDKYERWKGGEPPTSVAGSLPGNTATSWTARRAFRSASECTIIAPNDGTWPQYVCTWQASTRASAEVIAAQLNSLANRCPGVGRNYRGDPRKGDVFVSMDTVSRGGVYAATLMAWVPTTDRRLPAK